MNRLLKFLAFFGCRRWHVTRYNSIGWACERVCLLTSTWEHRHYSDRDFETWKSGHNPHRLDPYEWKTCFSMKEHDLRKIGKVHAPEGKGWLLLHECTICLQSAEVFLTYSIQEFTASRNTAFLSLDEERIRAHQRRFNGAEMTRDPLLFWGEVHKAITSCPDLPLYARRRSKLWLTAAGLSSHDDGDL